ncbi:MAG: motility associated factor glycosyltransferase family protein [Verrucomicrobia bacterium]|nr:motility associated factor glycosyltransferase family protein [Verrucomicrobiota bacterium]
MDRENLSLLMERFPGIGLLASTFPVQAELKEDFSRWRLKDVEVLYIYGLSLGAYRQVQAWLQEKKERRLVFLESEEGAFGALLQYKKSQELLFDIQVELVLLPRGRGLGAALQALAEKHPVKTLDVLSLPSRSGNRFRSIRLQLLRKTTLTHALFIDRSHGYQPFQNFLKNVPHLADSFYINGMKGAFAGVPAIICGAGPSLKKAFETIRTLENRALIFAGGSAIAAFSAAGIQPHFCIAIDPNEEELKRLKNSFAFEIPFLYSTRVHPGVFHTSNGPFGYLRSGIGGVSELWIEEELELTEPLIGEHLSSESITVTAIAVSAAQWLGCNPILLSGLDMAYTGGQRYSSGVGVNEGLEGLDQVRTAADRIVPKKDRSGQTVFSAVRWVMESASLSHYAKAHPEIRFINTTEGGIGFEKIDYLPFEKAAQELTAEYDLRGMIHAAIAQGKMSEKSELIPAKMAELRESLEKVISYLHILTGEEKGSGALAEMEMKEEIAYCVLFYDIPTLLPQMLRTEEPDRRWHVLLKLARQYRAIFCSVEADHQEA